MDTPTETILRELFPGLEESALSLVEAVATRQRYPAGTRLCRQGVVEDTFYVILDGEVDVVQEGGQGQERRLQTLPTGRYFGEMGVLDQRPRYANVTTSRPTTVLELTGSDLEALLEASPAVSHAFSRHMLAILRSHERELWQELLARKAAQHELEIGRQIQQSFLPRALPELDGWEIATYFEAAREVSGDFYDVFHLAHGRRVGLLIGDVCDKGVGAALFMALFRSLLRAFADQYYGSGLLDLLLDDDKPARPRRGAPSIGTTTLHKAVTLTNEYITRHHGHSNMFATLFFALLDPQSGALAYINAGQEPPVILGKEGVRARLVPTGPVVGMMPDMEFQIATARLAPGETLLAFTDGLNEARAGDDRLFGDEQLQPLLQSPPRSAAALLERLTTAAAAFTAGVPQSDDLTLLAIRRAPDDT